MHPLLSVLPCRARPGRALLAVLLGLLGLLLTTGRVPAAEPAARPAVAHAAGPAAGPAAGHSTGRAAASTQRRAAAANPTATQRAQAAAQADDRAAAVPATPGARGSCVDDERVDTMPALAMPGADGASGAGAPAATPAAPRQQLLALVQDALSRSNGIGAARLLAEAAQQDVEEARAARKPTASLVGTLAPTANAGTAGSSTQLQASAGLQLSQTVYDGGRAERMIDWRRLQAEAARLGLLSVQEQITLAATSLAFERSRYRTQVVIYGQNVRKMACLVESLEAIVSADRGRLSELVQARKQKQQAELQQAQAVSMARQIESKLRRMAGDGLPATDGFGSLLVDVPELPEVLAAAERSTDILALDSNAAAMREMARAVEAGTKPQVSWSVGGSAAVVGGAGTQRNANLNAGVTVNIPLINAAVDYSMQAARKRADAALLQRAEALEQRRLRIVDMHEQASSAFDRVRRVSLVLKDSERLRNFTLQQWQQLGRRSLFDVIGAESEHYNLRVQYINALHDGQQMNAMLLSLSTGLTDWLR